MKKKTEKEYGKKWNEMEQRNEKECDWHTVAFDQQHKKFHETYWVDEANEQCRRSYFWTDTQHH